MKNRTKVLSLAAAVLFIFSGNSIMAQEAAPVCKTHEFSIGAIGAANLTTLFNGTKEVNKNFGFGLGYNAGITASYGITKQISLVADVNFAYLTTERTDMQPLLSNSLLQNPAYPLYANFKKTESFDYFEVPVMVRYTTGMKHVKFYVNVGPYMGFVASSRAEASGRSLLYKDLKGQTAEGGNTMYTMDGNVNNTNNLNTISVGLTGGAGIGYAFGRNMVIFDARYDIGLTDIRNNTGVNGSNNMQTVMFGLGYNYVLFR